MMKGNAIKLKNFKWFLGTLMSCNVSLKTSPEYILLFYFQD